MGIDVALAPNWPTGLLTWLAIIGGYSWGSWLVARRWGRAAAVGFGIVIGLSLAAGSGAAAEIGNGRAGLAIGGAVAAAVALWPALVAVTWSAVRRAAIASYDRPRPLDIGHAIALAGLAVLVELAVLLLWLRLS